VTAADSLVEIGHKKSALARRVIRGEITEEDRLEVLRQWILDRQETHPEEFDFVCDINDTSLMAFGRSPFLKCIEVVVRIVSGTLHSLVIE